MKRIMTLVLVLGILLAACAGDTVNGDDPAPDVADEPTATPSSSVAGDSEPGDDGDDGSVGELPVNPDEPTDTETVTNEPGDTPPPDATTPTMPIPSGDRGQVFIDESGINVAESFPIQVFVFVVGNAPTPCHEVAWEVSAVDGRVDIELFSIDSGQICQQVLAPFEVSIPAGSFDAGDWKVFLNGEEIGEFSA